MGRRQEPVIEPLAYSPRQVAQALGLGIERVKRMIASGEIESVAFGPHTRRVTRETLNKLLNQ